MTKIEYIGGNVGTESWWGPVTGIRYEFGGTKRVGFVDDRDLAAMLDVVQGRKPVFRRYVQPAAVAPVAVRPAASEPAREMAPVIMPTPAPIYDAPTPSMMQPVDIARVEEITGPLTLAPQPADNELFHGEGTSQLAAGEMDKPKRVRKPKARKAKNA